MIHTPVISQHIGVSGFATEVHHGTFWLHWPALLQRASLSWLQSGDWVNNLQGDLAPRHRQD